MVASCDALCSLPLNQGAPHFEALKQHPNHPLALAAMAVCHAWGWGTTTNKAAEGRCYNLVDVSALRALAETTTNEHAQFHYGRMLERGSGALTKDETEAVRWYRLAAMQGHAPAQNNLGRMYMNGQGGLPKDDTQALHWLKLATDQDFAVASWNTYVVYDNQGKRREAERWKSIANKQGFDL